MKSIVSLSLDTDLIAQIRSKDINLSGVVNDYLRIFLDLPETEQDNSINLNESITELSVKLAELKQKKKEQDIEHKKKVTKVIE